MQRRAIPPITAPIIAGVLLVPESRGVAVLEVAGVIADGVGPAEVVLPPLLPLVLLPVVTVAVGTGVGCVAVVSWVVVVVVVVGAAVGDTK